MSTEKNITIYFAENYAYSWYDSKKNVLVMKIYNLNLGAHRQLALEKNMEAMGKYKPTAIILDGGEARESHAPSDLEWITNVAFPKYKSQGIERFILIFPTNFIAKVGAKTWTDLARKFGFTLIYVDSMDEALSIL